jgi:hypothetical protein
MIPTTYFIGLIGSVKQTSTSIGQSCQSVFLFSRHIPDSGKASMNIIISSPDKPENMHILGKDFAI